MIAPRLEFWQKHRGLVWSNPNASDAAHIRAALLRPRFERLLAVVLEFGLERVRAEWAELLTAGMPEVEFAHDSVVRILNNIETGFSLASFRH